MMMMIDDDDEEEEELEEVEKVNIYIPIVFG